MILYTEQLMAERHCTRKVLRQTGTEGATLELQYEGAAPAWAQYMEPVTLMHRGAPLFTGKVVRVTAAEEAGAEGTTTVVVQDFFYLLANATLGAQVAEVRRAAGGSSTKGAREVLHASLNNAMQSWATLAASCRMESSGWTVDSTGTLRGHDSIGLNTSRAEYSFGRYMQTARATSTADAMQNMRAANPDCLLLPNYATGMVDVVAIGKADAVVWDTQRVAIISATDIGQDYDRAVTGVAVAVSYPQGEGQQVRVALYPEELTLEDIGVRLFTVSADTAAHGGQQLNFAMRQAQAYYAAANEVQYTGTVVVYLPDVEVSPLGCRLSITGAGARPEWATMCAVVSEVEWDFTEQTLTATLGYEVEEPELAELQWETPDSGGGDGGDGDGGGGGGGDVPPDDGGSKEDGSGEGSGGGPASITAEVLKSIAPRGNGTYDLTLEAKPAPAGKYTFGWALAGQTATGAKATFKRLEYGTRYTFKLKLTNTVTREHTELTGDIQEDFEPLTLTVEDSVGKTEAAHFEWRLAWLASKATTRATVEIDNGDPIPVSGAEYTARVIYGVHTARVEVETAAGEKAAQVVTISHLGPDDPTPPPAPPAPPTPPSGGSGDGSGSGSGETDDFGVWADEEPAPGRDTYTMMLTACTTRGEAWRRYSYVWWVDGKTYTGQVVSVAGLEYGRSYRYTLVAEDAATGKQARADSTFEQRKETSIPCTTQVVVYTNPGLREYSADIFILSTHEGASYKIEVSGGTTAVVNDRAGHLQGMRYGVDYYYTATVMLPRPNSQGLTMGMSTGTIRRDAPDDPTPPTPPSGGSDTPPSGGSDTPPSGGSDTPPSGGSGTPPSGGSGTPPSGGSGCDCAAKLAELERRVAELEQKLSGSGCDCGDIVAAVEEALRRAVEQAVANGAPVAAAAMVQAVSHNDTVRQAVETTETGTISAKTTVQGVTAAGGGTASTGIGYNL